MNNINIDVIFEDNHLIAVNKKSGEIVQGDKTGDEPLSERVKKYLKVKYNKPGNVFLGTIHRIDRPTSGIVIFAKTSKALSRMNEKFRQNKISKTYWAIVKNRLPKKNDLLEHYLLKNQKKNKSFLSTEEKGKFSVLEYNFLNNLNNYFLYEIFPKTGRHHQIRVQLSTMGSPIKGDLKYGAKRSNPNGGINLHAKKIDFNHPVTKESVSIEANCPKEKIWNSIN
jgi:23S rRNA pseudouridine1911/1915/1917 synthase|tara:strand:- start:1370 stop:2044 length:675 start_codon:yes stop_codon:yes gene_type:complete